MQMKHLSFLILFMLSAVGVNAQTAVGSPANMVDEVIWVVGDEAILRSDVEKVRTHMGRVTGNPYCVIPENLAVQKLFIHQAEIDSIEANEETVNRFVEAQIAEWVQTAGYK